MPRKPETIARNLDRLAADLEALEADLARCYAKRLALYQEGVEVGMTHSALAAASRCKPDSVTSVLRRAALRSE